MPSGCSFFTTLPLVPKFLTANTLFEDLVSLTQNAPLRMLYNSKQKPNFNSARWNRGYNPDGTTISTTGHRFDAFRA